MSAKPRRQLHGTAEEIVLMVHRFARARADADLERFALSFVLFLRQVRLDAGCALDRGGGRNERRHDAVTGMFDFAAAESRKSGPDNLIVGSQPDHRGFVAEPLSGGG